MAKNKLVIAGSKDVTAPQITEFSRQIAEGIITCEYLAKVLHHFEPDRSFHSVGKNASTFQLRSFYRHMDEKRFSGEDFQHILQKTGPFEFKD